MVIRIKKMDDWDMNVSGVDSKQCQLKVVYR